MENHEFLLLLVKAAKEHLSGNLDGALSATYTAVGVIYREKSEQKSEKKAVIA
jgi:hypothetical protein